MYGSMQACKEKEAQWNDAVYFTLQFVRYYLSKYYADVTSTMGWLLISANIIDLFSQLRLFKKWDKGMFIDYEAEASYTTQFQQSLLNNVGDA